ncbi:MAG: TRAP transporter substrate-binding protein DctP [Gammaproteobacteria bacterium]|nr:TRAP transporter substrate-binding protein DctP [Gammaproteobacteria bacterium]
MHLVKLSTISLLVTLLILLPVCQAKNYKIATISPDGLSWMKKLRAGVKEIENQTEGRVKFKIYPGGVMGDDYVVLRKMRIGQLHGGVFAAGSLTRFYPDLQIYNLPLQFQSLDEVDYIRERMDQRIIDGLKRGGLSSFALTETGFAYLLSKEPVTRVEDLHTLKAWVPQGDPISAALITSFGISPIPLGITDVLAGLQTGLINAILVPPIVAIALQWHNHVKYMMDMPIMYIYGLMVMDTKVFSRISEPDREVVLEVMNRLFNEVDADNRKGSRNAYDALITQGIKVTSPGPKEIPAWQAMASKSIDELIDSGQITVESLNLYNSFLKEARQQADTSEPGE